MTAEIKGGVLPRRVCLQNGAEFEEGQNSNRFCRDVPLFRETE
jgi:hypothetical protein